LADVWLSHWQQADLLKPSVVKPVLAIFEQRLVIRQSGLLQTADQAAVGKAMNEALG
jgi:hypothetical protein